MVKQNVRKRYDYNTLVTFYCYSLSLSEVIISTVQSNHQCWGSILVLDLLLKVQKVSTYSSDMKNEL